MVIIVQYRRLYYQRNIVIGRLLSSYQEAKSGVCERLHNITHPLSIQNKNKGLEHLLPFGSLILPDLGAMAIKYGKKLSIEYNRYYNRARFKANIRILYGWGL